MDDLTQRPWWRWTTGLVVRVEGWGGRPVPCGVVVGSGEMARVADEWGTTPRVVELQAKGARVVPDLDSPATVGVLLERLREVAHDVDKDSSVSLGGWAVLRYSHGVTVGVTWSGGARMTWHRPSHVACRSAALGLIRALDDVTGVAP